jgi:hypothetical protein
MNKRFVLIVVSAMALALCAFSSGEETRTHASGQAKPMVNISCYAFTKNPIKKTGDSTEMKVTVAASPTGIERGDIAVVELSERTKGGYFTYLPDRTTTVDLDPGSSVNASFAISTSPANDLTGEVIFKMKIADVLRTDEHGNRVSILDKVYLHPRGGLTTGLASGDIKAGSILKIVE